MPFRGDTGYTYVQVCMTMMSDRKTEDREYVPLEKIRDNYPNTIATFNFGGIPNELKAAIAVGPEK